MLQQLLMPKIEAVGSDLTPFLDLQRMMQAYAKWLPVCRQQLKSVLRNSNSLLSVCHVSICSRVTRDFEFWHVAATHLATLSYFELCRQYWRWSWQALLVLHLQPFCDSHNSRCCSHSCGPYNIFCLQGPDSHLNRFCLS